VPSFFRPSFFFDRRPLSRRHAGPLYLSRAEQRDGGQSDIAPGAGSPPIPTENPKPIRRRKPRRLPRRSSSDPLGRSPAPPENLARVQLAPSPPQPGRRPLRSIRSKALRLVRSPGRKLLPLAPVGSSFGSLRRVGPLRRRSCAQPAARWGRRPLRCSARQKLFTPQGARTSMGGCPGSETANMFVPGVKIVYPRSPGPHFKSIRGPAFQARVGTPRRRASRGARS
jgi:hypothetical protein